MNTKREIEKAENQKRFVEFVNEVLRDDERYARENRENDEKHGNPENEGDPGYEECQKAFSSILSAHFEAVRAIKADLRKWLEGLSDQALEDFDPYEGCDDTRQFYRFDSRNRAQEMRAVCNEMKDRRWREKQQKARAA